MKCDVKKREVSNTQNKFVYLKGFDDLIEIKKDIKTIQESPYSFQISVLGLFSNKLSNDNGLAPRVKIEDKNWDKILGKNTQYGLLSSPEMGKIFIAGALTNLFLHKVEGKPLGEMTTGVYGILRGLGFDKNTVDLFLKDLKNGQYLLIIRGENNQIKELQDLIEG